jgi:DNA-binding transcriptional ArsR family regulator
MHFSHYTLNVTDERSVSAWSKTLFNDVHFLSVAAAVGLGPRETDALQIQATSGLSQPAVRRVLIDLESVELIERLERESRTMPQTYRRNRHLFWEAAAALHESAAGRTA